MCTLPDPLPRRPTAAAPSPLGLLLLTVAALAAEHAEGVNLGAWYTQRAAASSGLALGALALPWCFAGLAVQARQQQPSAGSTHSAAGGFDAAQAAAAALHSCLAASAAALLALLRHGGTLRADRAAQQARHGKAHERHMRAVAAGCCQPQRVPLAWWKLWGLAAALLAVVAQAAAAEGARGAAHAAAMLAAAGAAAAITEALLGLLPRTFTIGEAMVAGESAALLGSAALELLIAGTPTGRGTAAVAAAAATAAVGPYRRFVVLTTAGSALAAALLVPLLLVRQRLGAVQPRPATRLQPRANGGSGSGSSSSRASLALAAAALAVAAAAAAGLVPAGLWALRFALSTRRRRGLCAWWAANMAGALPIMRQLSASPRMPGILGEWSRVGWLLASGMSGCVAAADMALHATCTRALHRPPSLTISFPCAPRRAVRKGYHLLAVSLFLPALALEPQLLGVALGGAFAALLAVEALRLAGLPVICEQGLSWRTRGALCVVKSVTGKGAVGHPQTRRLRQLSRGGNAWLHPFSLLPPPSLLPRPANSSAPPCPCLSPLQPLPSTASWRGSSMPGTRVGGFTSYWAAGAFASGCVGAWVGTLARSLKGRQAGRQAGRIHQCLEARDPGWVTECAGGRAHWRQALPWPQAWSCRSLPFAAVCSWCLHTHPCTAQLPTRAPSGAGPLLITHFTLLLGMAAPVWLSNALDGGAVGAAETGQAPAGQALWLPAYAGVIILGEYLLECLQGRHRCSVSCMPA